jgi:hypothetical protein
MVQVKRGLVESSCRTTAALRGFVGSARGFTDLGQASRETEGERLEILCELDGRADQGGIDVDTRVLASSLAKRAPGYTSLGFPDPRRLQHLPPDCT